MATKRGLPEKRRMRHDRHFVDELANRMGEGIGRMISVSAIISSGEQPRFLFEDLDELASSIERHGVLEPLLVRRLGNGLFELVSGERRFRAAQQVGLEEIPCIELTVSDQQAIEVALVENLQRKDLNAFEEAEGFRTLVQKYEYTHDAVAQAVGKSRVTVTESLKLLAIPQEIRDICRHADINAKGILLEIARVGDSDAMRDLVERIIAEELDRKAIRELRQFGGEDTLEADDMAPGGDDRPEEREDSPPRVRPFVMRFKHPDQGFSVALSFEAGRQPEPRAVIEALEEMIRELREDLESSVEDPVSN